MPESPSEISLRLRLTPEQHAMLRAIAEHDHRSLNSQLITLIEAAFRELQRTSRPKAC